MRLTEHGGNAALDHAIAAATRFLLAGQAADGAFYDWELPPGPSGAWSTAYVAARLRQVPFTLDAGTALALRGAADWLLGHRCADGGWSYNDQVGSDADSTAHALLLLHQVAAPLPADALVHLRRFQANNGGFSTYLADDGLQYWGAPHVDVSAVCAQVFAAVSDNETLARIRHFIASERTPEGLWESYWWNTPLYATRHSLAALGSSLTASELAATRVTLEGMTTATDFEHALLLECLLLCGAASSRTDGLVARLTDRQQADGGWNSEPCLRVTRRSCHEPWRDADAGTLYADPRRLFTTSTVLGALCKVATKHQKGSDPNAVKLSHFLLVNPSRRC